VFSQINISTVTNFIANKKFEQIKETLPEGIVLKESTVGDLANLYLMTSDKSAETNNFINQATGLVFEKETNRLVCANQNKIYEVSQKEMVDVANFYGMPTISTNTETRVEYCEDGTIMRLYNYNGKWYTATTRCMDARESFWSCEKTFDLMFWEAFGPFMSKLSELDPTYTYQFILLHVDNRIVVKHNSNVLVYVSRINNINLQEDFTNVFYDYREQRERARQWNIRRPKVIQSVDTSDFESYYSPIKRGIIFKFYDNATRGWIVYKIDFNMYSQLKKIRGNVPQIYLRYLELSEDDQKLMEKYYPEFKRAFATIKGSVFKLVKKIHRTYVDSHIKHQVTVTEDNPFYRTLRQLHAQYKNTSKPISYEDVEQKLYSIDKNVLQKLLSVM